MTAISQCLLFLIYTRLMTYQHRLLVIVTIIVIPVLSPVSLDGVSVESVA